MKIARMKEVAEMNPHLRVFFEVNEDEVKEVLREQIVDLIDWSVGLNAFEAFCPYFQKQDSELEQLIAEFRKQNSELNLELLKKKGVLEANEYSGLS